MDSHASTCVAGTNCIVVEYTGRTATVEAYSPDYPSKEIPIATVATSYDTPDSDETYVSIINEALYFGEDLNFSLLSPNQLRTNDAQVDKRHRKLAQDSIFRLFAQHPKPIHIPFELDGVVAGFHIQKPTQAELDNQDLHLELTSEVEWNPHDFGDSLAGDNGASLPAVQVCQLQVLNARTSKWKNAESMEVLQAAQFPTELLWADGVQIGIEHPIQSQIMALYSTPISAVRTGDVSSNITPESIAKKWMVGIDTAKKKNYKLPLRKGLERFLDLQCNVSEPKWPICNIRD